MWHSFPAAQLSEWLDVIGRAQWKAFTCRFYLFSPHHYRTRVFSPFNYEVHFPSVSDIKLMGNTRDNVIQEVRRQTVNEVSRRRHNRVATPSLTKSSVLIKGVDVPFLPSEAHCCTQVTQQSSNKRQLMDADLY
jgi:hypothetical protein